MLRARVWSVLSLVVLSVLISGQTGPCEPGPVVTGDRDSDGIQDAADNCPDDANTDQLDADDDGVGDTCEDSSGGGGGGGDGGTDPWPDNGTKVYPENKRRCGVWSGTILIEEHRVREWEWTCGDAAAGCPKEHSGRQDERTAVNATVLLRDEALWHWFPVFEATGKVTYDEVNTRHVENYPSKCLLLQDDIEELHDSWAIDHPQIELYTFGWPEGFDPEWYYDFDAETLTFYPWRERDVDVTVTLIINPPDDGQQVHLTTKYTGEYQCSGGNGIPEDEDVLVDHPGSVFLDLKGTYHWDPNGNDRLDVNLSDDVPEVFDCSECCSGGSCGDSKSTLKSYEIRLTRFPEGDRDNDDVCDSIDNCPDTPNGDQLDSTGDGIGDECDPLAPLVP
ncbi:MAG: thrombospondin type 3 repeat-containing protein [Phycisphaerae bacterium]|jgi:hypothetical protein|nr:thrombospondin type 3 repeat-containing protein [Phycisphaerae bacterium]